MSEDYSVDNQLFASLIMNFQMSAMVGMGKLMNPVTNKVERKLEEARFAIDMLEMLARKTQGNLSDQEDKLLQSMLTDLRLNFVEESKKPDPDPEEETDSEAETSETASGTDDADSESSDDEETKE